MAAKNSGSTDANNTSSDHAELSARERQIMAVVHRKGQASAREIEEGIENAPSYSAVRALIRILERKGHLTHQSIEGRHIYRSAIEPEEVRASAMRSLLETFFDNSAEKAVNALLSDKELAISDEELDRLESAIEQARLRERRSQRKAAKTPASRKSPRR